MNLRNLFWDILLSLFVVMVTSPGLHRFWIFLVLIVSGFLLLILAPLPHSFYERYGLYRRYD